MTVGFDKMTHCMTEFLKNAHPFGMNFRNFRDDVYEFCQFEDARSIQISWVVMKIMKKLPSARIKVKTDPFVRNFS